MSETSATEQLPIHFAGFRWLRPGPFRVLVALYSLALVGATVFAIATYKAADWAFVLVLGVLFLIAEHRDRVFIDETGLSGSIAVALCASVYLAEQDWPAGALLCCAIGGMYLPHLRERDFSKLIVNAALFGISALCSAEVYAGITRVLRGSPWAAALALTVVTATYWSVNSVLLAWSAGLIGGDSPYRQFRQLVRSDMVMLIFGFGGGLCGVAMAEVGAWTGVATLIALLVALDVFVISEPAGLSRLRSAWVVVLARGVAGGIAGSVGAVVARHASTTVFGVAAALAAGMVAGLATIVAILSARLVVKHGEADWALVAGLARIEWVFPAIGVVSGVVTAMAGLDAGLLCASGMVVAGSVAVAVRRRRAARVSDRPIDDDVLMVALMDALVDGLPNPTRERRGSPTSRA
jgi:hypothetical protein